MFLNVPVHTRMNTTVTLRTRPSLKPLSSLSRSTLQGPPMFKICPRTKNGIVSSERVDLSTLFVLMFTTTLRNVPIDDARECIVYWVLCCKSVEGTWHYYGCWPCMMNLLRSGHAQSLPSTFSPAIIFTLAQALMNKTACLAGHVSTPFIR
jgi:hypothetical protein